MQKSAEVMKSMTELVKLSDISATMQEMSKEMMKVCSPNVNVRSSDLVISSLIINQTNH